MAFQETVKDIYLLTTEVENLYINESMLDAPGDYVKVYIYALYSSKYQKDITLNKMSNLLNLSVETIDAAFTYYENLGLVKKVNVVSDFNYDILFISQRDRLYGNNMVNNVKEVEPSLVAKDLKEIFSYMESTLGRSLSSKDLLDITAWKKDFNITDDLITSATKYCISRGKDSIKYIEKVIFSWNDKGLIDAKSIDEYISSIDERNTNYKKVLNYLGLNRNATQVEKELMDSWFNDLGFSVDRVLDACAKTIATANPNLNYVNAILNNWATEAKSLNRDVNNRITVSKKTVAEYYEYLRSEAERKAKERKEEIYIKIPKIKEIDEELVILNRTITMNVIKKIDSAVQKKKILDLETERAVLLTENNLPLDYTNIKYACENCKDTGVDSNGLKCSCYNERYTEAELWQKK